MAYGDITATLVDSWTLNTNANHVAWWSYGACKVAGNVFVAAYVKASGGANSTLMIETFACSAVGDITGSVIASLEETLGETTRTGWSGTTIMKIAANVFGVLLRTRVGGSTQRVYVVTYSVSDDGLTISKIGSTYIESNVSDHEIFPGNQPLIHIAGTIYALVTHETWGTTTHKDGYVIRTISITDAGSIGSVVDTEYVELASGQEANWEFYGTLRRINSTIFGLVCGASGATVGPTTLHTVPISDAGAISTQVDSYAFSTTKIQGNMLFQVKDTVWAVAYNDDSNHAALDTVDIAANGTITYIATFALSATLAFYSSYQMPSRFRVDVNKFLLFWLDASVKEAHVNVLNISDDGVTITLYDSRVLLTGEEQGNVLYLGTDYYLMASEGGTYNCSVYTFKVVTFRAGGWVQII